MRIARLKKTEGAENGKQTLDECSVRGNLGSHVSHVVETALSPTKSQVVG
jgi:hypothetical protein